MRRHTAERLTDVVYRGRGGCPAIDLLLLGNSAVELGGVVLESAWCCVVTEGGGWLRQSQVSDGEMEGETVKRQRGKGKMGTAGKLEPGKTGSREVRPSEEGLRLLLIATVARSVVN